MDKMEPSTSRSNNILAAAAAVEFSCTECGKKFRSWKALFGHMRCHPDRRHRGMLNYFRSKPTATTTEEDYEVADCLLMLADGVFDRHRHHDHSAANFTRDDGDGGADQRPNASNKLLQIKEKPSAMAATCDDRGKGKEAAVISMRHKCSKRVRVFSTGQALGRHKRPCMHRHHCKHEGEEGSSSACRPSTRLVNLGFDLNSCPLLLNVQGDADGSNYPGLDLELRL